MVMMKRDRLVRNGRRRKCGKFNVVTRPHPQKARRRAEGWEHMFDPPKTSQRTRKITNKKENKRGMAGIATDLSEEILLNLFLRCLTRADSSLNLSVRLDVDIDSRQADTSIQMAENVMADVEVQIKRGTVERSEFVSDDTRVKVAQLKKWTNQMSVVDLLTTC